MKSYFSVLSIETRVPEPSLGVTRIAYNFSAFLLIVGPFRNMLCAPIPFLPSCCLKRTDKAKKNRERVGWLQHSACKKKLIWRLHSKSSIAPFLSRNYTVISALVTSLTICWTTYKNSMPWFFSSKNAVTIGWNYLTVLHSGIRVTSWALVSCWFCLFHNALVRTNTMRCCLLY